jgi:hypothetical protein
MVALWKLIWRNSGKILNLGENQAEEDIDLVEGTIWSRLLSRNHASQSREMKIE